MEMQTNYNIFERRPIVKNKNPAVRWIKEWVPQDLVSTGGKCKLLRWVTEDMSNALQEKEKAPEPEEPEPEPTTEILFLCSYDGCGKTFTDAGALKKHSHIHGERQYACHYEGCGRKFLDSSKLKRHFLIHTGERHFVCPHEGCGKAFSLDFNLRAHMKTHSQENYHICPYEDCGKRYAHEYKLKTHIKAHHEKLPYGGSSPTITTSAISRALSRNAATDMIKQTPPAEKTHSTPKPPAVVYGSASDRPYACPYGGCGKCYIHEYKLNLHLRREHPGHNAEENGKQTPEIDNNDMDEGSDQDAYAGKGGNAKNMKRSKSKPASKAMPPSKMAQSKGSSLAPVPANVPMQKQWPAKEMYEEDSEETEEDRENVEENGWRYGDNNEDDEETEYED